MAHPAQRAANRRSLNSAGYVGDRWILLDGSHRRRSVPTYPGFVPFDFATNLDFMIFRFKNKANIAKYELILP